MMAEQYEFKPDGRVMMFLPGKAYRAHRQVGRILDRTYFIERNARSIFNSVPGGGIGVPYRLMVNGPFDYVEAVIQPEGQRLRTSRKSILKWGIFLSYASHQLEPQLVLPLSLWGREPEEDAEPTLFDAPS